jgi:hypothetical protein
MMRQIWRIASTAEFAEAIVAATLSNRSALRRVIQQTRRAGRVVADALQTSAALKSKAQLGDEIEIVFSPGMAVRDPDCYLDYALACPDGSPTPIVSRSSCSSTSFRRSAIRISRMATPTG